jgi:carboxymethylenebutenolidase
MQTINNKISLQAGGSAMNAYVAAPGRAGKHPGIILLQEAFGITSHIRTVANRMAAEGYVVIAPELFHRTAPGIEFDQNNLEATKPHYTAVTTETMQEDIKACYTWLQLQDNVVAEKIGSIGFCLGGRASFVANFTVPLSAAITYYGSGIQTMTDKMNGLHGSHLFFWGGQDAHITQQHVAAVADGMRQAGKAFVNVVISYAGHAFNNEQRANYNAEAAMEAWAISMAFFKNKLQ